MTSKEQFEDTVARLITLGENKEELDLLVSLFDTFDEQAQQELLDNVTKELEVLQKTQ